MVTEHKSKISIIMATLNRSQFIMGSLHYIQQQTFTEFECLIIDDGSIDKTEKLVLKVASEDSRMKYYKRTSNYQKGLPGCRNYGLDLAKGDYIVFFDDDDIPHPRLLELAVKNLKDSENSFCRYGRTVFSGDFIADFDNSEEYLVEPLPKNITELMIIGKVPFNSCQILWKRSCFDEIRFNEKLLFAEEWECYTRILIKKNQGINLKKVLYHGRKHAHSNTGEFQNKNKIRFASKIHAAQLIIEHLRTSNNLNQNMRKFFIRMAFDLRSNELLNTILKYTNTGNLESMKYKFALKFYPLIRPVLKIKGKLKSA